MEFVKRVKERKLTKEENPYDHFCIFFAAYDPEAGKVFYGHHKKSGLWLFNGGHIEVGETPEEALVREMGEEWGIEIDLEIIGEPKLLTITEIDNPTKQTCTRHYDIWYFVPVSMEKFNPDELLLKKEYSRIEWMTISEARNQITHPNTLIALSELDKLLTRV